MSAHLKNTARRDETARRRQNKSLLHRIGMLTAAVPATLVVAVVCVLMALEIDPVLETTTRWGLKTFNPLVGASMNVDRVSGGLLTGIVVDGFKITSDAGDEMVRVRTASGYLQLLPLIRSHVSIAGLRIVEPKVRMRQQPDSTWDLINAFPSTNPDQASSTTVAIRQLTMSRGDARLQFADRADSTFRAWNVNARATRFSNRGDLRVRLDSLDALFQPPGAADTVNASIRFNFGNGRLDLQELSLVSAISNMHGSGSVMLPADGGFDALNFTVTANPLSFRDIQPFLPSLNPGASVALNIRADGNDMSVHASGDARFGDGSTIVAEAVLSPPRSALIDYTVDASVERLDPGYLFASASQPTTTNRLSGVFKGSVRGASKDSLSGELNLRVDPFRYRGYSFQATDANIGLSGGSATVKASTAINGSQLGLSGGGRFLDEEPTYDGVLSFANVDVSRLSKSTSKSNLRGRVTIRGKGVDWASAAATASTELRASSWNDVPIRSGRIVANLRQSGLDLTVDSDVGEGRISSRGRIDFSNEERFSIQRLALTDVPVMGILGDTTRSTVNGQFSGSGRGFDLQTMSLRAEGTLSNSVYGSHEIVAASLTADLKSGTLDLNGNTSMRGGNAVFRVSGRPFGNRTRFDIREMSFRAINFAELTGASDWITDINGSLTGEVLMTDGVSRGTVSVRLDSSTVNRQLITSGRLDGTLANGDLEASFEAITPQGLVAAATRARPFDDPATFHFSDGTFEDVNLGAITGRRGLNTRLNGRFDVKATGTDPMLLVAGGVLEINESRFNGESIESGRLTVSANSGGYSADATFQFGQGDVTLRGNAGLADGAPFALSGALREINVAALLGPDSLSSKVSGNIYLDGSGIGSGDVQGKARLALSASTYGGIKLDVLTANATIGGKMLRIDTLTATSNVALLSGNGVVALSNDPSLPSSDLTIQADIVDLKPLHRFLPPTRRVYADGRMTLTVSGEPSDVRFRADGQLTKIAYKSLRIGAVEARIVGSLDENRKVASAEGRIEISQLSLPTLTSREARIEAAYNDDRVNYEATAVLDDRREIRTSGVLDLSGEEAQLTMNTVRVRLDKDRWQLLQPSTISFGAEYRIQNFLLYSETQQIAVDGYVDLDGEQSLILTIEQFRIGGVADLLNYGGMDGTLNGYIDLSGPAEAPLVTGSLTADIRSLNKPVGDLALDLNYSDLQLSINGRLRNDSGAALIIDGQLPIDLRLSPPDDEQTMKGAGVHTAAAVGESTLTLKSDGFGIDWILPFLDPNYYSTIGGVLTGQMDVRGTFSDPSLSGSAVLKDGVIGLTEFGVTFTSIAGNFTFRGNRIVVDRLQARSGPGSATVTGSISLSDLTLGDFDLEIRSQEFLAVDNREYRASAASTLRLTGSTRQPVLSGHVDVASADIFLSEEIEEFTPVRLSLEDLQTVEQRFGIRISEKDTTTFSFYEALTMDLTATLSRNTWLRSKRNPTMDIQFTGDLEVQKKPNQLAQVFGSIEVIPERSRIVQFGKSFKITKGALTYNGPIADPVLDIQAEYDIRAFRNPENQVTITLTATGRFDDLNVELSSDPLMETTDIVSYIAFGRPASESLQLGGSSGGSFATDLALGQIAGLIENVAGTGLGLDVVEIEQQGLDARLTAGKYVHRRLYLAISQPLNLGTGSSSSTVSSTREITAEFELLQSLLLRILTRRSSISVNLLWQYAY